MKVTEIYTRNLTAIANNKRFIVNQGGTSSSKTYSILQSLIYICLSCKNLIISVVSETYPHLKRGVIRDFYHILQTEGLYTPSAHNKTDNSYRIGTNLIEFFPATRVESMKGARRDILFVNEANGIEYDIFDQLEVRTNWFVLIDFNPVSEFWVHEHLLANGTKQDVEFIHSTYRSNPYLSDRIVESILRHKNSPYWWKVYGEGEIGQLEGVIFRNWRHGEFDQYLPSMFGMDFGFNDPDTLIRIAIDHKNMKMYWDERIYHDGNTPNELKEMVRMHCTRNDLIWADCADARMIADMKRDFNIRPVDKTKWTVSQALKLMQNYEHIITEDSTNVTREFRNYLWSDRRAGIPIDDFNHAIDAGRYVFMMNAKPQTTQSWHMNG